jgi:hypothetical protein
MRQDLSLLSDDCPSLLFNGKFADLVALNCGGPHEPRPMLQAGPWCSAHLSLARSMDRCNDCR